MTTYWDPLNENLSQEEITVAENSSKEYFAQLDKWQTNTSSIKRPLLKNILITCFFIFLAILSFIFLRPVLQIGFLMLFFAVFPVPFYLMYIYMAKDLLIYSLIAKQHEWLCELSFNRKKCEKLHERYAEIISNPGGNIQKQLWGQVENKNSFWMGCYDIGGDLQHFKTVFAFPLSHEAATDVLLRPVHVYTKIDEYIGKRDTLSTESNEFNKFFRIVNINRPDVDEDVNILDVLNPRTMENLIDFQKYYHNFTVLFRKNVMIVSFDGEFQFKYTNLFRKIAIDERDEQSLFQAITSIAALAGEILPCID